MDSEGTMLASNASDKISDFYDFHTSVGASVPIKVDSFADIEIPIETQFSHPVTSGYQFLPFFDETAKPFTIFTTGQFLNDG